MASQLGQVFLPETYPYSSGPALARTRMCSVKNIPERVDGNPRINLGGGDTLVPQELLDHPDISPALNKVRGTGVTEGVR